MRFTVKSTTTLILASKSPRRIELMTLAGFDFLSVPAVKEEKITGGTSPSDAVLMLSRQKAEEIAEKYPYNTVIGADTEVVSASTIAIHLGYPKEKIEKALQYLLSINSTNKEVLEISVLRPDNHTEKVYGVRNFMPEMIVLLTGAFSVLNQPHGYQTSVNNRDYPFFDRKDMSFIKMGEKNEEK